MKIKHKDLKTSGILQAFTLVAAVAGAVPAFASASVTVHAPAEAARSHRVSFNDLDLTSVSGKKTLHSRLQKAVDLVCAPLSNDSATRIRYAQCTASARNSAKSQIETAVSNARTHPVEG